MQPRDRSLVDVSNRVQPLAVATVRVFESYCSDCVRKPKREDDRIEAAMRAIENLNAVGHDELVPRVAEVLTPM